MTGPATILPLLSIAEYVRRPRKPRRTHRWQLDSARGCLYLEDARGRELYWIDLARCQTSAQVLDWIVQVSHKLWATDPVLAGLVRALDQHLDLQASMCSFGLERGPINATAIARRRRR